MKPGKMDTLERRATPVEDHFGELGLLVKRADLMVPPAPPNEQGSTWTWAVTWNVAQEVILTFEQADRATYNQLRSLLWLVPAQQPEVVAGVSMGLRACLGPRALMMVAGDPRTWWLTQGRDAHKGAVLWAEKAGL